MHHSQSGNAFLITYRKIKKSFVEIKSTVTVLYAPWMCLHTNKRLWKLLQYSAYRCHLGAISHARREWGMQKSFFTTQIPFRKGCPVIIRTKTWFSPKQLLLKEQQSTYMELNEVLGPGLVTSGTHSGHWGAPRCPQGQRAVTQALQDTCSTWEAGRALSICLWASEPLLQSLCVLIFPTKASKVGWKQWETATHTECSDPSQAVLQQGTSTQMLSICRAFQLDRSSPLRATRTNPCSSSTLRQQLCAHTGAAESHTQQSQG